MSVVSTYNLTVCPFCSAPIVPTEAANICSKEGSLSDEACLTAILDIPSSIAGRVAFSNDWGAVPKEADVVAYNAKGIAINALKDGKPLYSFPTLWGDIKAKELILWTKADQAFSELHNSNVITFTGQLSPQIVRRLAGKKLYVYGADADMIIAKLQDSLAVKLTQPAVTIEAALQATEATGLKSSLSPIQDDGSLRWVIESRHYSMDKVGNINYSAGTNEPMRKVVEAAISWFRKKGAKFLWDDMTDTGYMFYKDELYRLKKSDSKLRSLLFAEGGICSSSMEGAAITDGLVHLRNQSIIMKPEPWLTNTIDTIKIHVPQGSLMVTPEGIKVDNTGGISYASLYRSLYIPFEYNEKITPAQGSQLLWDCVGKYCSLPKVATEILLVWLCCIFLKDLASTRPIVRLWGAASSGKSTIIKLIYMLFYGQQGGKLQTYAGAAGLWRSATVDPLIPFDNENVGTIKEELRTFLDMCSTGGLRVIGSPEGGEAGTKIQQAHSLVIMSGLDDFVQHDLRTRALELKVSPEFKTDFYDRIEKETLVKNRADILSGIINMHAELMPHLPEYLTRERIRKYRIYLDTKERLVDYFALMCAVGERMQSYGTIEPGDLAIRWSSYLREIADKSAETNSLTVEWWKTYKIVLASGVKLVKTTRDGTALDDSPQRIIEDEDGRRWGIVGTKEELIIALAWAASATSRQLPWRSGKELESAMLEERKVYDKLGWSLTESGTNEYILRWGDYV